MRSAERPVRRTFDAGTCSDPPPRRTMFGRPPWLTRLNRTSLTDTGWPAGRPFASGPFDGAGSARRVRPGYRRGHCVRLSLGGSRPGGPGVRGGGSAPFARMFGDCRCRHPIGPGGERLAAGRAPPSSISVPIAPTVRPGHGLVTGRRRDRRSPGQLESGRRRRKCRGMAAIRPCSSPDCGDGSVHKATIPLATSAARGSHAPRSCGNRLWGQMPLDRPEARLRGGSGRLAGATGS
jgi:hypothetical protein